MNDPQCIFCKIVAGDIPSIKIYEDDYTYAFLDIKPVNVGHTLVIPKKHFSNLYELESPYREAIFETAQKVARAIKTGLPTNGINLTMNNDAAAGQIIFHAHVHIIPRYENDGMVHWNHGDTTEDDLKEAGEKITRAL